jgi:hypothetical protein
VYGTITRSDKSIDISRFVIDLNQIILDLSVAY